MATTLCGFDDGPQGTGQGLLVQFGPTLIVDIGFDAAYNAAVRGPPDLPIKGVHALVDTGATISCIDSGLAMQLNLPIIDRQRFGGAGGAHEANMHLGQIYVPNLDRTIYGSFASVDLVAGGQQHVALIGRTFLRHFTMRYLGRTGTVSLSDDPDGSS